MIIGSLTRILPRRFGAISGLTVSLSIPEARSLKDKRRVLRSVKDRIMSKMNVSVAEVGRQDEWNYADLAFVTVTADKITVDQRLSSLSNVLHSDPCYVLLDLHTEIL
jgi:uncharacterized protein YlxP (DUF503 family)